ncbi:MAG: KTSC domain-containing protein [Acetatifactor sp.]|nr:KTSC domain-containing protein [Acetatifactor sp.]
MFRCKFAAPMIASAGYDPVLAVLEVEFAHDGQVWQYMGVPEEIWYRFKKESIPESFFHSHIKGCYDEKRIMPDVS